MLVSVERKRRRGRQSQLRLLISIQALEEAEERRIQSSGNNWGKGGNGVDMWEFGLIVN